MVVLAQLLSYLPIVLGIAALGIAVWALAPLRSRAGRARVSIPVALITGCVMGIATVVALGSALGLQCFDAAPDSGCGALSNAETLATAVAGLLVGVASIVGYAFVARVAGRGSILGSIVGPIVLVAVLGGTAFLSQEVTWASQREAEAKAAADIAARSTVVHPTIGPIHVTTSAGGSVVETVQLRVTLHVDREIRLDSGAKSMNPRFVFAATGGMTIEATGEPSGGSPLESATDTRYDLTFVGGVVAGRPTDPRVASTFVSPTPGTWRLRIEVLDDTGAQYQVETDVVIAAAA
jgi:hypothetical protein